MHITIAHFADIHIDKETDEYNYVFNCVYEKLKEIKPDYIVLAGDIFDSYKITMDTYEYGSDVIENLFKLCRKLVVMPGNHDTAVKNPDNIPVTRPIMKRHGALTGSLYFEESTVFEDENSIVWGVVGPKENRPILSLPENSNFKIGLFHEEIQSAKLQNGRVSRSDKLKTCDFAGYDVVMGGHIHLYQVLDGKIVYPGSLIQQNFGEPHDGHGFVLWSIDTENHSFSHTFIEILNPYACVNFVFRNGELITKADFATKCKRWKITTNTDHDLSTFIAEKTAQFGIEPEVILNTGIQPKTAVAIHHTNDHEQIIGELLAEHPQSVIEGAIEMYKKYTNASTVRRIIKLGKLTFENAICFEQGCIDFEQLQGKTSGFNAANESGKTSVFHILIAAIYGIVDTVYSYKEFIRKGTKICNLSVEVMDGTDLYLIRRTLHMSRNTVSSITKNGIAIAVGTELEVNQYVEKLCGSSTIFRNVNMMQQSLETIQDANNLMRYLQIVDVSVFEKQFATDKRKNAEMANSRPYDDLVTEIESITTEITAFEGELKELESMNTDTTCAEELTKLSYIRDKISHNQEYLEVEPIMSNKPIDSLIQTLGQYENTIAASIRIVKLMKEINDLFEYENVDIKILEDKIEEDRLLENNLRACEKILNEIEGKIAKYGFIWEYQKYKPHRDCDRCKHMDLRDEIKKAESLLGSKQKVLDEIERIKVARIDESIPKILSNTRKLKELKNEMAQIKLDMIDSPYPQLKWKILQIDGLAERVKSRDKLIHRILECKVNIKQLYARKSTLQMNLSQSIHDIGIYQKMQPIYEALSPLVEGKKAKLPQALMQKFMPLLTEKINNIMAMSTTVKCTANFDAYKLFYQLDGLNVSAKYASGFRKAMLGMAINIAIWELSMGPVIDGLFMDEWFASCDSAKVPYLVKYTKSIVAPSVVCVVTHHEGFNLDHIIGIESGVSGGKIISGTTPADLIKPPIVTTESMITDAVSFVVEGDKMKCIVCGSIITASSKKQHLTTKKHMTAANKGMV